MPTKYDAIIIGAGQSGPSLVARLAGAGMQVAIIERKRFGGTCVKTGCIPTKTLVASVRAAYIARRRADFGVMIGGPIAVIGDIRAQPVRQITNTTAVGTIAVMMAQKYLEEITCYSPPSVFTLAGERRRRIHQLCKFGVLPSALDLSRRTRGSQENEGSAGRTSRSMDIPGGEDQGPGDERRRRTRPGERSVR